MKDLERLSKDQLCQCLDELSRSTELTDEARRLLHELEVYQVELEIQNRELREAQEALEISRDRYADLYLHAPMGYMTLDERGTVREINFAGAELLGTPRAYCDQRTLFHWMAPGDSVRLLNHLKQALANPAGEAIEVRLRRTDGDIRDVRLQSRPVKEGPGQEPTSLCRCAMLDITERRRAEQALREREAQYRAVIETCADGFLALNMRGQVVEANDAYANASGYPRERLLGMHIQDLDGIQEDAEIAARIAKILREGSDRFETRHRTRDGSLWDAEVSGSYWPIAEGRLFVFVRDIRERKRAEQALRDSEARFRVATASVRDAFIMISGEQGQVTWWNPAAESIFGYREEEVLGRPLHALLAPPSQRTLAQQGMLQFAHSGDGTVMGKTVEILAMRKDGGRVPVELSLSAMRIGESWHAVGIARDISERKQVELALDTYRDHLEELVASRTADLSAAQEQARLLLEYNADGIYGIDLKERITFINRAACEMLGQTQEALIGGCAHELFHHHHADGTPYPVETCPLHRILQEDQPIRMDRDVFWRADGTSLPVAYAGQPIYQRGEVVGAVISFVDITQRKAMEDAREAALREAERLAQARSDFLANMSHEIRTPLNAVLGLAQVGARENLGRKTHDTFARILDAGQLLLGLVDDILDFSRIEAGKLNLEQVPFVLGEALDRALDLVAPRAYAKKLNLRVEEGVDLPERCQGDALRLSQVLLNLLSNAVKFTERGEVSLWAGRLGKYLVLRVADTGIGMRPDQIERLFSPFEQADGSSTRRFGGTGLGLAITRQLVDLMGGDIRVESWPDAGSVFEVRLPLVEVADGESGAPPLARGKIVLAGLEEGEARPLVSGLAAHGLEVIQVPLEGAFGTPATLVLLRCEALQGSSRSAAEKAIAQGQRVALARWPGHPPTLSTSLLEAVSLLDRPLRVRHLLAALSSGAKERPVRIGPRLTGLTILAAEDNEVNRLVLEEILAQEGARSVGAENGKQVLERVRWGGADAFDVVLMDIQMPEMDGYEATRRLRELAPGLPVIGLTAHAMVEERGRCLGAGMVEHLTKPIQVDRLVDAILTHARRPADHPVAVQTAAAVAPVGGGAPSVPPANPVPPGGPGGVDGASYIDWASLEARYASKPAFLARLLGMVPQSHADMVDKLHAAADDNDLTHLAFLAHNLKGMSGNLMAWTLQERARKAEQAARAGQAEAGDLARDLARDLSGLLAEIAARQGA